MRRQYCKEFNLIFKISTGLTIVFKLILKFMSTCKVKNNQNLKLGMTHTVLRDLGLLNFEIQNTV